MALKDTLKGRDNTVKKRVKDLTEVPPDSTPANSDPEEVVKEVLFFVHPSDGDCPICGVEHPHRMLEYIQADYLANEYADLEAVKNGPHKRFVGEA